jgi:hypothetical protein
MNYPVITELEARALIESGTAGYWELSLRDSLGKKPIAHPVQTCVFLAGAWYLVPVAAFALKSMGRVGDGAVSAAAHSVAVYDPELISAIKSETTRLGKHDRCRQSN